jgi:hypothetical protein
MEGAAKNDHNLRVHLALSPASLPTLHAPANLERLAGCYTSLALSRRRHVLLLLLLLRLWMTLRVLLLLLILDG